MRVFQSEAREFDLRVADGQPALQRVAEQVRRVEHPESSVADDGRGGDVEAFQDVGLLVVGAIAIGVLEGR